jgi:hypothetical protein
MSESQEEVCYARSVASSQPSIYDSKDLHTIIFVKGSIYHILKLNIDSTTGEIFYVKHESREILETYDPYHNGLISGITIHKGTVVAIQNDSRLLLWIDPLTLKMRTQSIPENFNRYWASIVSNDEKILLIGGIDYLNEDYLRYNSPFNTCIEPSIISNPYYKEYSESSDTTFELDEEYDETDEDDDSEKNKMWIKHDEKMLHGRCNAGTIFYRGNVYVVGGYFNRKNNGDALDSVEFYDTTSNCWVLMNNRMTKGRYMPTLFEFSGEIYVVGGDNSDENTTIEKMDKDSGIWEMVAMCPENRNECAVVLVGSKIFLLGGIASEATFDYYDLVEASWASSTKSEIERALPRNVWGCKAIDITLISEK